MDNIKKQFLSKYTFSSSWTQGKYKNDIDLMLNVCGIKTIEDMNNFNSDNIEKYYKYCEQQNYSVSTINQRLQIFKVFVKWLNTNHYIDNHFIEDVKNIRASNQVHYTPTREEINQMLEYIRKHTKKKRLYIMFNLLINTGLRRSEVCNLKISDIDFENNCIKVVGKGKKIISQPVHKDILVMIKSYIESERIENMKRYIAMGGNDLGYIFVTGIGDGDNHHSKNLTNGNKVSENNLFQQIKKTAELSGIKNADKITPHSLRRFAGTSVYELTGDIKTASEFLRHSNISTTEQCYIKYNREKLVNATNELFSVVDNNKEDKEYQEYLRLKLKYGMI